MLNIKKVIDQLNHVFLHYLMFLPVALLMAEILINQAVWEPTRVFCF